MCDSEAPDFAGCLSVVVPMRDEADNVLPLLDEIDAALQGLRDDEVIFAGMAVATRPPRAWPRPGRPSRLLVLRLRRGCGQSTAAARGRATRAISGSRRSTATARTPADLPHCSRP